MYSKVIFTSFLLVSATLFSSKIYAMEKTSEKQYSNQRLSSPVVPILEDFGHNYAIKLTKLWKEELDAD